LLKQLRQGLSKTRGHLSNGLKSLLLGRKEVDKYLLEDIETQLLSFDVGIEAANEIVKKIEVHARDQNTSKSVQLIGLVKDQLESILEGCSAPLCTVKQHKPFVILTVGVNGAGKTTTIGKLAKRLQSQGQSVMLAAGDTFRAAAVEQLEIWGSRNEVPVVAQEKGSDSASVIFDAYQSAKSRHIDVLIADTAGRLHTKDNLMNELEKIVRVLKKQDESLPDEILLVLDATTGQNALAQAESFNQYAKLTGIALTKLDGTAKGGIIFAISKKLNLPIRFVGVGEGIDDLKVFDSKLFISALFSD
jgi:fused signal recognition particle receptor